RENITSVSFPSGLSSIGNAAFYECKNIIAVTLPNSVEKIGEFAFMDCTGIKVLSMGTGIRTIGQFAFSNCASVMAINIPSGVTSIGTKAFYRCETITSITVPKSVTYLGLCVFGYCRSLVTANIFAEVDILPEFMFYNCEQLVSVSLPDNTEEISKFAFGGCDSLNTVYYEGDLKTPEEIQSSVGKDVPGFENAGTVTNEKPEGTLHSGVIKDNGDGTYTQENITLAPNENSSVTVKTETPIEKTEDGFDIGEAGNTQITVTINGANGWEEAKNAVEQELEKAGDKFGTVKIDVYISDTSEINEEFVNSIAGKNITLTVMTADGSVWKINGMKMDTKEPSGVYDLSYTLTAGDAKLCEALGAQTSFVLTFNSPAAVNAEVLIRIGTIYARQNATLFQKDGGINRLQSVVVDSEGYAHFYLGSVSEKTEYYIAMNLPDAAGEAIIPQNMLAEYGYPEYTEPIKYEITGRESSWGMNLGQVMGILAAVMITVVIVVGVIMYIYNKRRLRNGYVPSFEDEE
ncbi:MAG: leucine-rich repeat domain-containing protein, partial [Clostridia bacterium]|nr:leucine-rich repeat domain-containing protein [Clostridia bacterium]